MFVPQVRILFTALLICSIGSACGDDGADPATSQDNGTPFDFNSPSEPVGTSADAPATQGGAASVQETMTPTVAPSTGQDVMVMGSFEGCPAEPTFTGQVGVMDAQVPDGGQAQFTPYDAGYDAGISAIVAMVPAMEGENEVNLAVTGATVVATDYFSETHTTSRNRTNFWIADGVSFKIGRAHV